MEAGKASFQRCFTGLENIWRKFSKSQFNTRSGSCKCRVKMLEIFRNVACFDTVSGADNDCGVWSMKIVFDKRISF